jgi:hypothetical protein
MKVRKDGSFPSGGFGGMANNRRGLNSQVKPAGRGLLQCLLKCGRPHTFVGSCEFDVMAEGPTV